MKEIPNVGLVLVLFRRKLESIGSFMHFHWRPAFT